jgi:7-keto-8-aminopelargonate synthetase-like enzyme
MKNIEIKHVPLIVFCLAFAKSLLFGSDWPSVGMAVVIATLAFLYQFKVRDKQMEEVSSKFKELDEKLEAQSLLIEEQRSFITGIKLNNTRGPSNGGFRI